MFALKRLAPVLGLVAAAGLAACGSDKAAGPDAVDPAVMADGMADLTSEFATNAAFQSLASLSGYFQLTSASAALRATLPMDVSTRSAAANFVTVAKSRREAMRLYASLVPSSPAVLFPSNVLGKTYVWDVNTSAYVQSAQTGAPANGVRFILYVAGLSGPTVPLQQLGFVDLTDESTPQADILGVLLKLGTATVADYTISAEFPTQSSLILTASGRLTNPNNTSSFVDFTLEQSLSQTSLGVDYHVQGSNGFTIDFQLTFTLSGASVNFAISNGGNTLSLSGTLTFGATSDTVNFQIKYNGTVVATVTGSGDNPTITGSGGRQLSEAEIANLVAIWQGAGEVLDALDAVFEPGSIVFGF